MVTTYRDTELESLKAQFEVLKKYVGVNNLVNEEMIMKSVRAKTRALTNRRVNSLFGIAADVFMAVMSYYAYYTQQVSLSFFIATIIWCLFCAILNYQHYQLNIRERLMDGTVAETVQNIVRWRQMNRRHMIAVVIASIIWVGLLLVEQWPDLVQNTDHAVFVFLIVGFVMFNVIGRSRRVQRVTSEMLEQLKEIQEQE